MASAILLLAVLGMTNLDPSQECHALMYSTSIHYCLSLHRQPLSTPIKGDQPASVPSTTGVSEWMSGFRGQYVTAPCVH